MSDSLSVSLSRWGKHPKIGMMVNDEYGNTLLYVCYPITYLEACDFSSWANWANHTPDVDATLTADGWLVSMPIASMPFSFYKYLHLHDSHRRIAKDSVKYADIVGDSGYVVSGIESHIQ